MRAKIVYFCMALSLVGCNVEGVKKEVNEDKNIFSDLKQTNSTNKTLAPTKIVNELKLKDGLNIKWFKHGKGDNLKEEEVIQINYQVFLEDGTLVDGNELLNRSSLPFLVGYGMQTKGWDLALLQLKVGDFVEIFLPSKLARGKYGVKGLIPPNANNIIRLKILNKVQQTKSIDGVKVWLLEENTTEKKKAIETNSIDFHYMVGTKTNPKYDISYRRGVPFRMRFSDRGLVSGLKKAMVGVKRSDKVWILVPPDEAYGNKGLLDLVKPNEKLFYDIFVVEVL
jgi:FKBP-type peptidyl-prolyl cis-trans isomerase